MSNYDFGNYICSLREKKSLSQKQLGDKLGVTNKAISKWENGGAYPSVDLMLPLARELGVSIEELYNKLSNSKMEKSGTRKFIEMLCDNSKIIMGVLIAVFMLSWSLFLILGNTPDKIKILILSLIMPLVVYLIIRFMFYLVVIKNPMASAKVQDFFAVFFLAASLLNMVSAVVEYISVFPNGMIAGAGLSVGLIGGVLHFYK